MRYVSTFDKAVGLVSFFALVCAIGLAIGTVYNAYEDSRYDLNYTAASVKVGGSVWSTAEEYINKQDRYGMEEFVYYIIETNRLTDGRYMKLQPGDVLRLPMYTLKKD